MVDVWGAVHLVPFVWWMYCFAASCPTWCGRRARATGGEAVIAAGVEPPRRDTPSCPISAYDRRGASCPCATSYQLRRAYKTMNAPSIKHGQSLASIQEKPYCCLLCFGCHILLSLLCYSREEVRQRDTLLLILVEEMCFLWRNWLVIPRHLLYTCETCPCRVLYI